MREGKREERTWAFLALLSVMFSLHLQTLCSCLVLCQLKQIFTSKYENVFWDAGAAAKACEWIQSCKLIFLVCFFSLRVCEHMCL